MSLSDIARRCLTILSNPKLSPVAWVGVFGSFARGQQRALSDVDLLVGYRKEATSDEIFYIGDISREIRDVVGREVDVIYMRDGQRLDLLRCQALLIGKTIYGSEAWTLGKRVRAAALAQDTHKRLTSALHLATCLRDKLADVSEERFTSDDSLLDQVASDLEELVSAFDNHLEEAKAMNGYFRPVIEPLSNLQQLAARHQLEGFDKTSAADKQHLWQTLSKVLPDRTSALRSIYMPVMEEVLNTTDMGRKS